MHGELLKLGFRLAQSTVSKYLPRHRKPPSQSWRTFLRNHLREAIAIDFAVVSTVRFGLHYVFVVLGLERRRLLHVHVTSHPTAVWTAQQMIEALPEETGIRYVIRDRDAIYGTEFRQRVAGMNLVEVPIAPRSPWQNGYAERFVGSLRRECLDHVIALNERQVRRIVSSYARYYNRARTHLALAKDAPEPRTVLYAARSIVPSSMGRRGRVTPPVPDRSPRNRHGSGASSFWPNCVLVGPRSDSEASRGGYLSATFGCSLSALADGEVARERQPAPLGSSLRKCFRRRSAMECRPQGRRVRPGCIAPGI